MPVSERVRAGWASEWALPCGAREDGGERVELNRNVGDALQKLLLLDDVLAVRQEQALDRTPKGRRVPAKLCTCALSA